MTPILKLSIDFSVLSPYSSALGFLFDSFLCFLSLYLTSHFLKIIYLFIFGCVGSLFLCEGFSLVAASGGHSSSRCAGLSLSRPLLLQSTGSRRAGSVVVAHGTSHSAARGILPDQGSNPRSLHWQADSQPPHHQGSPSHFLMYCFPDLFSLSVFSCISFSFLKMIILNYLPGYL